jgi:hypothetical protein
MDASLMRLSYDSLAFEQNKGAVGQSGFAFLQDRRCGIIF